MISLNLNINSFSLNNVTSLIQSETFDNTFDNTFE
jgi:hypothetical protein